MHRVSCRVGAPGQVRAIGCRALGALSLILLLPSNARPQRSPTFGASAELVLIDLIATDGQGQAVTDLRPEEIAVYEDGKPQRLEAVRYLPALAPEPGAAAAPAAVQGRSRDPLRLEPAAVASPPILVVVLDLYTLRGEAVARSRDAILSLARAGLQPGSRLMLVTLDRGVQIRQPLSDDVGAFITAVEALRPSFGEGSSALSQLVDRVSQACDGSAQGQGAATGLALGIEYVETLRHDLEASMKGLGALAGYLSALSGRKNLVLFSEGHPVQPAYAAAEIVRALCDRSSGFAPPPGRAGADFYTSLRSHSQVDAPALLRDLLDEANRAQVSIYTVDARGLGSDIGSDMTVPASVAVGSGLQAVRRALRSPQEILRSIAEGTGGTAAVNTNDLGSGMRDAARDAGYYLLAYAPPPARKEGRFYPIELKVSRPGLQLRYRKGYEWLSDQKREERTISGALLFPALYREDGLTVEAQVEAGQLGVTVTLPTAALVFADESSSHRNDVALYGLLRDHHGKLVGRSYLFTKSVALKLSPERYQELRSRPGLEIPTRVAAPKKKGRYQMTVVAQHSGSRLAAAVAEVEVP